MDTVDTREHDMQGEEYPVRKPWTAPVLTVAEVAEVTQATGNMTISDGTGYS